MTSNLFVKILNFAFLIGVFTSTNLALSPEKLKFRHLTEENGLTNSHIHAICQDKKGFIWIGTENGLYRYDGFQFKHYTNIPGDTNSINSNIIFRLYNDAQNNLWVGTFMGLLRYDDSNERFYDIHLNDLFRNGLPVPVNDIVQDPDGPIIVVTEFGIAKINPKDYSVNLFPVNKPVSSYSGKILTTYYVDRQGNHWMGTRSGTEVYNKLDHSVSKYDFNNYALKKFNNCFIHRIYQDSKMNIWVATREDGVFFKAANTTVFHQFYYKENDKFSLGSNETYDIWEDHEGQIWISTNGGGLNMFDSQNGSFIRVKHVENDKSSLLNNNTRSIFEDRQGNIWITSFQAGINIHINHPQLFKKYNLNIESNLEYQSNTVSSIYLENNDILWIGTDGGGLKLFDRKNNSYKTYLPNKTNLHSFPDKVVMAIYKDRYNENWFGTYQGGLAKYDPSTDGFLIYKNIPGDSLSISNNFVTCMTEDKYGNLWIGTSGGGLNLFDRNSGKFKVFRTDPTNRNSLIDNYINTILVDHKNNLWIGTFWGLSCLNIDTKNFTNYRNDKSKSNSISHNSVIYLYQGDDNKLWIGTYNGLNLYNPENNNFICYTEKDGLAGNVVNCILGDNKGNLWISTNYGITKFDTEKKTATNYSETDGLQGNEFFHNSGHIGKNGEFFFGGINGFNSFFPDSIRQRNYAPQVIVTGFRIFEHEVPIGKFTDGRILLSKNINETKKIELKYSDKIFSFDLAAIDFINPQNIVYAYQIEGFDKGWNYTDAHYPKITYTNLNSGEYKLKIKAANRNIINDIQPSIIINIKITPPFWKTWWAFLFYLITIFSIAYYLWRLSIQRIKDRNMVKLEKLKREKSEEINQAKLRFFTNISHEFRTPLTLIIGPLEKILAHEKESQQFRIPLNIMLKNARRMLRLINQLLDLRKFENEKMQLKAEYSDIIKFIEDIIHSFEEYAIEKRINFKFITPVNSHIMWFDADKLDKIIFNLLSNAFKFTPEKGSITVEFKVNIVLPPESRPNTSVHNYIKISVSDTGIGIPEKDLPNLFERFYQAGNKQSFHQGSGLGLSLTKNMVEIHSGKIEVTTEQNKGTTFHVYLPQDDTYLSEEQKMSPEIPGVNKYIHLIPDTSVSLKEDSIKKPSHTSPNTPTLLLVEDHIDLRIYLENEFRNNYNFYSASNGKEGFELAVEIMPDIIISDVMMPEMDGLELCNCIKNNIITSHIPIILLTAKTSVENQIAGFESGADAYVPKPFRIDQLTATVNSIIENRNKIREKYSSGKGFFTGSLKNTADDKFLQKATESVLRNISEVDFGVLELSRDIGISRVHLHRKLKAIANVSPNEFIRNIRLNKSGELLLQREFTISEICYKVGFNSPAYFSSCFKNYFQMSPTEFIEKHA